MKKYIYTDHSEKDISSHKIILTCEAEDITEADKKYTEATGKDPRKQTYIGCQICFDL